MLLVCCSRYGWSTSTLSCLLYRPIQLSNNFLSNGVDNLTENDINSIGSLLDIMFIRE